MLIYSILKMTYVVLNFIGECPFGPAWADKANAIDSAHQQTECSNAGSCNRQSGQCQCFKGFTGIACQRSMLKNLSPIIQQMF